MSEDQPTPGPNEPNAPQSLEKKEAPPSSPNFGLMFGLGIVLIFVSWGLCYLMKSPTPFFIIGLCTFFSLFFRGYRGIFVGYITSIGVGLLGVVIYCANHPLHM